MQLIYILLKKLSYSTGKLLRSDISIRLTRPGYELITSYFIYNADDRTYPSGETYGYVTVFSRVHNFYFKVVVCCVQGKPGLGQTNIYYAFPSTCVLQDLKGICVFNQEICTSTILLSNTDNICFFPIKVQTTPR